MRVQILRPNDCYEALYVDGVKKLEGDPLDVDDVIEVLTGKPVEVVSWEDYEDDEITSGEDAGKEFDQFEGTVVWINGEGCPQKWPFADERTAGYQNPDGN